LRSAASVSLAGLLIAENGGLFGLMEQGYRQAIVISIATILLLGAFAAVNAPGIKLRGRRHRPSGATAA
jgi:hypothetical protein